MSNSAKSILKTIATSVAGAVIAGLLLLFFGGLTKAPADEAQKVKTELNQQLVPRIEKVEKGLEAQQLQEVTDREDIGAIKADVANLKALDTQILNQVVETNRYLRDRK